ncbi:MAG: hypothetical protein Kow0065_20460 [Methylomicrobium sp.]
MLVKLKHPNIVRVFDFFEANGTAYLLMDYEHGETLDTYLKRRNEPLVYQEVLELILPVLDGLRAVHKSRLLHLDIKPENIFLRHDSTAMLIDFGSARQFIDTQSKSVSFLVNSSGYSPPEQYSTEPLQGPWSDIYALAATLYHAVCGQPPIPANTRAQAQLDDLPDPLEPAKSLGFGRYPDYFLDAIDRGLRLARQSRPESVRDFQYLLQGKLGQTDEREAIETELPSSVVDRPDEDWQRLELEMSGGRNAFSAFARTVPVSVYVVIGLAVLAPLLFDTVSRYVVDHVSAPQTVAMSDEAIAPIRYDRKTESKPSSPQSANKLASTPAHTPSIPRIEMVSLPTGISIGKYEITQGQWFAVMGTRPSHFTACGDDCPVENVSWDEVQAFVTRLGASTGKHYRLPTENEWIAACLAGRSGGNYCSPDPIDESAWYSDNSDGTTHPVGKKRPNPWGLYDMNGNVWEWTDTCWQNDCTRRVLLGGSWIVKPWGLRAANRLRINTGLASHFSGFRLVED